MDNDKIKNLAKQAKRRLKNGFWEDYRENVDSATDGECVSERSAVVRYFRAKAERELDGASDEEFYLQVKNILDTVGDVCDIIGRLCDETAMKRMSFQDKQRYLFELSARYRACRERHEQEKRFEKRIAERKNA